MESNERKLQDLLDQLRQGRIILCGDEVVPLRPEVIFLGQTGVGKSTVLSFLTGHLCNPEEYREEQERRCRPLEELESSQLLSAKMIDSEEDLKWSEITMPTTFYEDERQRATAESVAADDMDLFKNYGLPDTPWNPPGLILPTIGGSGTVGSTLPAAISYGSEPQLLVILVTQDWLLEQLNLYLDQAEDLSEKASEEQFTALKQLWQRVVMPGTDVIEHLERRRKDRAYQPPLRPIVADALGTAHKFCTRCKDQTPNLYLELHYISSVQQLLNPKGNEADLQLSLRATLRFLQGLPGSLWDSCHSWSIEDLVALQSCVQSLDVFVPSPLLHVFNTKLEDSIGAGDGVEQRRQRQYAKEAEVENIVVMLDKDLKGSGPLKDHLKRSPFLHHWMEATVNGCIGTPPRLSIMYSPRVKSWKL